MTTPHRILVVDDERSMREFLEIFFRREGFDVVTAENVDTAEVVLENDEIDVVITDMQMPGRSGLDLLHAARELSPESVVIVITAFASTDSAWLRGTRFLNGVISSRLFPRGSLFSQQFFLFGLELLNNLACFLCRGFFCFQCPSTFVPSMLKFFVGFKHFLFKLALFRIELLPQFFAQTFFAIRLQPLKFLGVLLVHVLEARFLLLVDQQDFAAIAALDPVFTRQREQFRIQDSVIFSVPEEFYAIAEYSKALGALERDDEARARRIEFGIWVACTAAQEAIRPPSRFGSRLGISDEALANELSLVFCRYVGLDTDDVARDEVEEIGGGAFASGT